MTENKSANVLFELFRRYNIKTSFFNSAFNTEHGLIESHLLLEIEAQPSISLSELQAKLNVDISTISRSLSGLKESNLVLSDHGEDRRKRIFKVTKIASKRLDTITNAANEIINTYLRNLKPSEEKKLKRYLQRLVASMGAPEVAERAREALILPEMRRMSRIFGVIARSFLNSRYSFMNFQILSEIGNANSEITSSELMRIFNLSSTALSLTLKRLLRDELISSYRSSQDRRYKVLSLTKKGQKLLGQVNQDAYDLLQKGLLGFKTKEIDEFISLFFKLIDEAPNQENQTTNSHWNVREISDEKEQKKLRGAVIRSILRDRSENDTHEKIIGEDELNLLVEEGSKPLAVIEFEYFKERLRLTRVTSLDKASETQSNKVLAIGLQKAFALTQKKYIYAYPEKTLERALLGMGGKETKSGIRIGAKEL